MCLGIPGRVVEAVAGYGDQLALVDVEGARRRVNVGLLDEPPAPGQWVLIHMGFVVETVDADGAARALAGLEMMGRPRPADDPDDPYDPDHPDDEAGGQRVGGGGPAGIDAGSAP